MISLIGSCFEPVYRTCVPESDLLGGCCLKNRTFGTCPYLLNPSQVVLVFGAQSPGVSHPGGNQEPLVASLLLVAMPGAPSGVFAPSSKARSPEI